MYRCDAPTLPFFIPNPSGFGFSFQKDCFQGEALDSTDQVFLKRLGRLSWTYLGHMLGHMLGHLLAPMLGGRLGSRPVDMSPVDLQH